MASRRRQEGSAGAAVASARHRQAAPLEPPRKFKVLLHDDDFTTMEFVVGVLREIFGHAVADATRIMLDVHQQGVGLAGIYPHEVAEAKAAKVIAAARRQEFPFLATLEPVAPDAPGEPPD